MSKSIQRSDYPKSGTKLADPNKLISQNTKKHKPEINPKKEKNKKSNENKS